MKKILIFIVTLALVFACKKKDEVDKDINREIISGKTYNKTLLIDGHKNDGLIIENCTFENIKDDGIQIRNVDNLTIRNCIFKNIDGNAIRFRTSGSSNNVEIENNEIFNIKKNGIMLYETHTNAKIRGNTIHNVGIDPTSSAKGAPHHGIYAQGSNVEISKNKIYDIINDNGNCVSIRSSGKVSENLLYKSTKNGISYFSDHSGKKGLLMIENNIIYDNLKKGISLASNGKKENHIGSTIIRFNTVVGKNKAQISITDNLTGVSAKVEGNIVIRTDGGTTFIFADIPISKNKNLTGNSDIGFVDFVKRDLHIKSSSSAKNFASGLSDFPKQDFDGNNRNSNNLDAGADEIE